MFLSMYVCGHSQSAQLFVNSTLNLRNRLNWLRLSSALQIEIRSIWFFPVSSSCIHISSFSVYQAFFEWFQIVFWKMQAKQCPHDSHSRRLLLFYRIFQQKAFHTMDHLLHQNYRNKIEETKIVQDGQLQHQNQRHNSHFELSDLRFHLLLR